MANELLLLDGFDRYPGIPATNGGFTSVWTGGFASNIVTGRFFGGKAVYLGNGFDHFGSISQRWTPNFHTDVCLGAAVKVDTITKIPLLTVSGPTDSVQVVLMAGGRLRVCRGVHPSLVDLALSTDIDLMVSGAWHYIEMAVKNGATTGAVKLWVDGQLVIDATNVNTGTGAFDTFGITAGSFPVTYDDFYAKDGMTPFGEIKIETLDIAADATNSGWTAVGAASLYDTVNDSASDGDTTYMSANTAGAKATFEVQNLSITPEVIKAIQVRSFSRKDEAGLRTVKQVINSGGTEALGAENYLSTSYTYTSDIFQVDPKTGLPWTAPAVDALKVGVKVEK